jgi:hypothetical protein
MVDSSFKTTNKTSVEVSQQANSFLNSGVSTGANTKSGGKPATTQYISVPSDHNSHGSKLLIQEQPPEQLP